MTARASARPVERLADGMAFLEGPRWHDGRLWVSDFFLHRVYVLEEDGLRAVAEVPAQPSGIGFLPDGDPLVVSMLDRRLLRLTPEGPVEWADLSAHAPAPLNDLLVDSHGRAYVGSYGSDVEAGEPLTPTWLLRVDPDGSVARVAEDLVFPNGMALTPDGRTLIVAESYGMRLTAFDVGDDGGLSGRRTWASFGTPPDPLTFEASFASGLTIPDGIALDAEGAVWVANPAGTAALRVAEGGEIVGEVETGGLGVYALALGGPERKTLYMCAGPLLATHDPRTERRAVLLAAQVDVPGAGLP